LTSARERRKETRAERRNTVEIEVQVETLSPVVFENLVRNYRSELTENDRLRLELRELKDSQEDEDGDGSVVSTDACCESEVEMEMEITPGVLVS
jgi:regulator of replication initiation timing